MVADDGFGVMLTGALPFMETARDVKSAVVGVLAKLTPERVAGVPLTVAFPAEGYLGFATNEAAVTPLVELMTRGPLTLAVTLIVGPSVVPNAVCS